MSAPLIELDRVSRTYTTPAGTIKAVDDVSLSLGESETICLVGESGCGKTTTGRMLAGLLRPSSGRLLFEGADVWEKKGQDLARFRRSVQLVHQDPYASLNPTRTIAQTLAPPLAKHKKAHGRAARAAMISLLERVGLTPPADFLLKYPHQLSGGQRQRVSIARALTVDPRVIVADEAVSMVDVSIRISLLDLLHNLATEFHVTTVLITHDLAVARWRLGEYAANFPMALDEAHHRLFVVTRRPAQLLVFDTGSGKLVAHLAAVGDSDDVWFDAALERIYASGGEGFISVFEQTDADHYRALAKIPTAPGARTSFFSPELGRLYLAVPHRGGQQCELRIYEVTK